MNFTGQAYNLIKATTIVMGAASFNFLGRVFTVVKGGVIDGWLRPLMRRRLGR